MDVQDFTLLNTSHVSCRRDSWLSLGSGPTDSLSGEDPDGPASDWSIVKHALKQAITAFEADPVNAMSMHTVDCGCKGARCMAKVCKVPYQWHHHCLDPERNCPGAPCRSHGAPTINQIHHHESCITIAPDHCSCKLEKQSLAHSMALNHSAGQIRVDLS